MLHRPGVRQREPDDVPFGDTERRRRYLALEVHGTVGPVLVDEDGLAGAVVGRELELDRRRRVWAVRGGTAKSTGLGSRAAAGLGDGDTAGEPAGVPDGLAGAAEGCVVPPGEPAARAGPKVQGGAIGAAQAATSDAAPMPPTIRPPRWSKARRLTTGAAGVALDALGNAVARATPTDGAPRSDDPVDMAGLHDPHDHR